MDDDYVNNTTILQKIKYLIEIYVILWYYCHKTRRLFMIVQNTFLRRKNIMNKRKLILLTACIIISFTACNTSQKDLDSIDDSITFTVSYPSQYFVNAVDEFNKSHQNVKIKMKDFDFTTNTKVQTGSNVVEGGENESKRVDLAFDEYVKIVNAGLMSGGGYDIIKISGLDYKKYIDKDLLVDFNELMRNDNDFSYDMLNTDVIDLLKYNNKLCILPLNFNLYPLLVADADAFNETNISVDDSKWNIDDFYSITNKIADAKKSNIISKYPLAKISPDIFLGNILFDRFDYFVDYTNKKASFDKTDFEDMLKLCKNLSSEEIMNPNVSAIQHASKALEGAVISSALLCSPYDISMYKKTVKNFLLLAPPTIKGTENRISCSSSYFYAINKNSKHINEAWEFIKLLISEEMQSSKDFLSLSGFPVNNSALETMLNSFVDTQDYYSNTQIEQKDISLIKEYINKINYFSYFDSEIARIITDEVGNYFSGKKTEWEVAQIIQKKVTIYLNEQ